MNEDLRKALSSIEGVERSEVELVDDGPLGIRIRLARDADRRAVADSVQRLLEAHGLRSRVAPDRRTPGPDRPPAPPPEPAGRVGAPGLVPGPHPAPDEPAAPLPRASDGGGIETVTVSETFDGVVVSVAAVDGRVTTRRARRTDQALHEALVSAVAELAAPEAPPAGLLGIEHSNDFAAMTVYLEGADGRIRVGASVVLAGNPFAFAQAVWAALQS